MKPSSFKLKLQRLALSGLLLGAGPIHDACADTWVPGPPTYWVGTAGTHLGTSVAIGTYDIADNISVGSLYVGAPMEAVGNMAEAGAVHVYTRTPQGGWIPAPNNLVASVPQAGAHFGASLAYSAGHLVVGSPDYSGGGGYVEFFNDHEGPPANIVSEGHKQGYGSRVAVDQNFAAIGFPQFFNSAGGVNVFRYQNGAWASVSGTSVAQTPPAGDALGSSVAIRQTSTSTFIVVAGSPGTMQNGQVAAGAAHVYIENVQGTGLLDIGALAADSPAILDVFGASVGIDANFIYVGAPGRDNGVGRVGSVTIFKPASIIGYDYLGEYFPSAPATIGGHCGASLSVDPYHFEFILGCPGSTGTIANEGTARVYRQFSFLGQPVWLDSVLSYGNMLHGADALGSSVAIYGNHAFAGAPNANFPSPQTGNGRWLEFLPDKIFKDGFGG